MLEFKLLVDVVFVFALEFRLIVNLSTSVSLERFIISVIKVESLFLESSETVLEIDDVVVVLAMSCWYTADVDLSNDLDTFDFEVLYDKRLEDANNKIKKQIVFKLTFLNL